MIYSIYLNCNPWSQFKNKFSLVEIAVTKMLLYEKKTIYEGEIIFIRQRFLQDVMILVNATFTRRSVLYSTRPQGKEGPSKYQTTK